MPRLSWERFREEVLALYEPPARSKNSWFKARQVLDLIGGLGIRDTHGLTPATINQFIRVNPSWRPETVRGLLAYLKAICRYAAACGYVPRDPFSARSAWMTAPACGDGELDDGDGDARRGRPLSAQAVAALLAHLRGRSASWTGGRIYALTATVAYTGLRRNEAICRAVADFDLEARLIRVRARRRRLKTRASEAPVPIPDALAPILTAWLPRAGCAWAFPGVRKLGPWTGGPYGARALDELRAAGEASGVGPVNFLSLRHTWATQAEAWGLGELMVQRVLRHARPTTQRHYRHADAANMVAAVRAIDFDPAA